jgi:3-dehydroquinate synthase
VDQLSKAGMPVVLLTFPGGEKNKTIASLATMWQAMLAQGIERRRTLIALGGGVTSDLGGYTAAAYMRGIPWIAMPTSLLGMVDASIGGKTGVDLEDAKNIVGAFHPPRLVLVDPDFLDTLTAEEFDNGMAEVIEAGIIGDEELFQLCSQGRAVIESRLPEVIARAIAVKVRVIQADPFETGLRAVLNLGHTLGHALEAVSGYGMRHGEAVAAGMVAAARLAERRGLAEPGLVGKIGAALQNFNLPTALAPTASAQALLEAMRKDKKRASGGHRFVLPHRIGQVTYGNEIDEAEICTLF